MKSAQQRFGFLVHDIGRLYSLQFDRLARERLGLSQAQCRLLGALGRQDEAPLSQAELAQKVGLSAMAVAKLCDRMAAAGWIERIPSPTDRRANHLRMAPRARKALEQAMAIADDLNAQVTADLSATERQQLLALLQRVREALLAAAAERAA